MASVTALVAIVYVGLVLQSNSFRRSFGASENGPLVLGIPLVVMLVLLASLLFPAQRALQHVAVVAALSLAACSVWIIRESIFLGIAGLTYCGLWSAWYWNTAWTRTTAP